MILIGSVKSFLYNLRHYDYEICRKIKRIERRKGIDTITTSKRTRRSNTRSAIGLWEKGKRTPSLEAAIVLAIYFNVTLDYLAGLEN